MLAKLLTLGSLLVFNKYSYDSEIKQKQKNVDGITATSSSTTTLKMTTTTEDSTSTSSKQDVRQVKAILFDMDGTLLDTETLSDKAVLQAFGESLPDEVMQRVPMSNYRLPWIIKKPTLGLRGNDWIPLVIDYGKENWDVTEHDAPSVATFWKTWEQGLNDMCNEIGDCDGATELVEELSKTGIPMAIATSSQYNAVEKKRIRHDRIFNHIKIIVAGDDPALKNGKPAPDIYIEAAKRLNVDPKDCLVFEDALSGVISGKAAGCQVVAIPDPRFSEEDLQLYRNNGADVVLRTLRDFDGSKFGIDVNMANKNNVVS